MLVTTAQDLVQIRQELLKASATLMMVYVELTWGGEETADRVTFSGLA